MTDPTIPPQAAAPEWVIVGRNSGVYATIAALVETAAGPHDQVPLACEQFALMVDRVDDPDFEIGCLSALIATLYLTRLALSATSMDDDSRYDPSLFTTTLDGITGMSSNAQDMLSCVADAGPQYEDIADKAEKYLTRAPRRGRTALFETLAVLLRAVVERHGADQQWDRWRLIGKLFAVSVPRTE